MSGADFLYIILSFFVGGCWILLITVGADRFGSNIGGFLGGLPSTVVIAFFFIGLLQGEAVAASAADVFPLAFATLGPFLLVYVWLIRRGLALALAGALVLWFVCSGLIVWWRPGRFDIAVAIWAISFLVTFFWFRYGFAIPSITNRAVVYTLPKLIFRGVFGGSVIGVGVTLSKLGGPVYGGIFASFPAVFISSLVLTHLAYGADFSRALAKSMMLSAFVNVAVYGFAVRCFYREFNLIPGTFAALGVSSVVGLLMIVVLKRVWTPSSEGARDEKKDGVHRDGGAVL